MKVKSFRLVLLALVVNVTLAGCGCVQQAMRGETAPPSASERAKITPFGEKKEMAVQKEEPLSLASAAGSGPALTIDPSVGLVDVWFDFDKYSIRAGDAQILKKNYSWFTSNQVRATVEGNCDERGSVEYNLVLGQKRADSARNYLIALGVDGKRLETISYGKEKPMDPGHDEDAWAKNRRVHFTPLQ